MQQGGYGQPPGGQPPGGVPPGAGQFQAPGGAQGWAVPGAGQPGAFPGQGLGAPHPQAAQMQAAQMQAAQMQAAQMQAAQMQAGFGGQGPGGAYGAPAGYPQAAQFGAGQFPGAPNAQHAQMQAAQMQAAQMQAAQMQAAQMQAAQMQAAQMQAGQMQAQFGAMGPSGPRPAFDNAQKALGKAGSSMKVMKYSFVTIGILGVLAGIAMIFTVDMVTGIVVAGSSLFFVFIPLFVLPQFSGMLNQATAMVDGFAAKERLAQNGIPAQGRLLSVQQTGRMVNMNPEIQALVEVHHPQLGVYQTQTTALVPQIAIPRAQPGSVVQLRVDPANQQEIALIF